MTITKENAKDYLPLIKALSEERKQNIKIIKMNGVQQKN